MLKQNKPGLSRLTRQNMDDAPDDARWVEAIKSVVNETARRVEDIRSEGSGISLISNADVEVAEVDVQMPDPWIKVGVTTNAPAFKNAWADASASSFTRFYKDDDGVVEIRLGLAGGSGAAGTVVFTLPSQYFPSTPIGFTVSDINIAAPAVYAASIDTSGNILVYNASADALYGHVRFLSLDSTPIPPSCWPKLIKTKFKNVAGVIVLDVDDAETTSPLPAGSIFHPVWDATEVDGMPHVKLLNVPGLPYNRKSHIRLLIIGGKDGK